MERIQQIEGKTAKRRTHRKKEKGQPDGRYGPAGVSIAGEDSEASDEDERNAEEFGEEAEAAKGEEA